MLYSEPALMHCGTDVMENSGVLFLAELLLFLPVSNHYVKIHDNSTLKIALKLCLLLLVVKFII